GIMVVNGKEDLIITCKSGITIRTSTADIREAGRATQGVKLIRIDEGDEIAAISKIQEQEEAVVLTEASIEAETEAIEKLGENESEPATGETLPDTNKDTTQGSSESEIPGDALDNND